LRPLFLSLIVLSFLAVSQSASAQYCPNLPADSPVLSTSPDDIPPGATATYVNYYGATFHARPNHQLAFVQTGQNEQKVWFSIDIGLIGVSRGSSYYNRRYRASESSPWYWQYSQSQPFSDPNNPIGFVNQVLYSATPKYTASPGGTLYKYVMYTINQPAACNGPVGGYAMVSFSNDGTCWTTATPLRRAGGPSSTCAPELGADLVPVEALGAIDSGSQIYLMGIEGDNSILINWYNMDHNYVSWGTSSPAGAGTVTIPADRDMSDAGLFNPKAPYEDPFGRIPDRFRSYAYFFNMAITWDAAYGDLYVTRGYPYPYDRGNIYPVSDQKVPTEYQDQENTLWNYDFGAYQSVSGCGGTAALYPNRYQIYKMHLGTLSNFSLVHTGTWTLVADRGNSVGYETKFTYASTPLVAGQTNDARDSGAASFLVDGAGQLVRNGGIGYVFAANTLRENLSVGRPCKTTGNERVVLRSIP
jgi:hypothetical protein